MPIVAHGIDLVEISRIQHMLSAHGPHFLDRCFTPAEQAYCGKNPKRQVEHLAARFAAKEAVMKALGTGWAAGITFADIEVRRHPTGKPTLSLHGESARLATELGITHWHLTLTHTQSHAMASVIAERL